MELRHLRYFAAVAETLHFGRAARRLHVSQPTVSQQVKQLEEELGAPLFERQGTSTRLTAAGELFRAYASRALEDVHEGERAVRALEAREAGTLRIGYIPSLTTGLVIPASSAVLRKYPGIRIAAYEGITRQVERRLAEGKLDVGIGFAPSREPLVEAEPVLESRMALVVPRRHPLANATKASLKSLAGEPFALLAPGLRVRGMVDAFFASTQFAPRIVFEANAVATVLAVVRAGLAMTVLPEPRGIESERLSAVPLVPAPQSPVAALLWRKGALRSPAALAFAEEARALATS
jgi:LysR family cyn operon transcriptional activator